MNSYRICSALAAPVLIPCLWFPIAATAQSAQPEAKPAQQEAKPARVFACPNVSTDTVHTFYLRNATQQNDANEIYTALRQMLPADAKSFFVPNQMAIEVCAQPEQIALAQKMLNELDRAKKNYRITYTVIEMEGTKRLGAQQFSMIVTPGQESTLKQGSRVPVTTGQYEAASQNQHTQFSYVDVGMNFQANIDAMAEGIRLRTAIEQSSVAEERPGTMPQDPVIRQATFKGTSYLLPGKPLKLGTLDIADSNRHLDLEVVMEPVS